MDSGINKSPKIGKQFAFLIIAVFILPQVISMLLAIPKSFDSGPVSTILMNIGSMALPVILLIGGIILFFIGVRIVKEYERGVVLTLGKYSGTRQAGLTWILPIIQTIENVDMRITTVDIPQQEAITKDNVPVGINAVVYFQVELADRAILNIQDYETAVSQYAQAALRDVIGGIELDPLLSERDKISDEIKKIVDVATKSWGVNVTDIKIQDIELPADMKRVMAKQAESERERRSVIIRAAGEYEASAKLAKAAATLSEVPGGMTMRTLATIEKINPDPSKTVIFALPIEVTDALKALSKK